MVAVSAYPPSFAGNPWSYGFALFSLTLICAFALAMLMHYLFDWRARREAQKINWLPTPARPPLASPLVIHRLIVVGFLATVLFGAFPDVLILLAWGESSDATMDALFLIDRLGDGLTVVPFTIAVGFSAWGQQVVPQQLIRAGRVKIRRPTWRTIKDQAMIAIVVLIIAIGVTIAKAKVGA